MKLAKTLTDSQETTMKEISDLKLKVNKIEDFLRTVSIPPPQIIYQPPPYTFLQPPLLQPTIPTSIPTSIPTTPYKVPPTQPLTQPPAETKAEPKPKPKAKAAPKKKPKVVEEAPKTVKNNHFSVVIAGDGLEFATDLIDYVFKQQKSDLEMVMIEDPITIEDPKAVFMVIEATNSEKMAIAEERIKEYVIEYGKIF
jgi:hypothetical protein